GLTDNDGRAVFNLDVGDHILAATAPGYIFNTFDTMNVTGADNDTIVGYRFNPGSPALADLCRVYGFIHGIGGEPVEGVLITAHLPDGVVRHNSTIISPYKQSVISDSSGYFHIDLIRSTDLTPSGAKYLISATYPAGTVLKKKITVPDLTEWQLSW
ncbi:MAG: hypothetical protein GY841_00935, partial [FCB group bacterium]|nr:hypothetical protein [FCB group bacterium]